MITMKEVQEAKAVAIHKELELNSNLHLECKIAVRKILLSAGLDNADIAKGPISETVKRLLSDIKMILESVNFID